MLRRLSHQIYWTFVSILLLFVVLLMVAWGLSRPFERFGPPLGELAEVAAILLPEPDRPASEVESLFARLHARVPADLALFDAEGARIAAVGRPLPAPAPDAPGSRILRRHGPERRPILQLALPDGRRLLLRGRHDDDGHRAVLVALGLLAVAVALGSYPLVRRLTRRLERLRQRVEALGAGDLATRVEVEGRDEIADLARSFNDAAGRIDRLVNAQRDALAAASHELRSPLARMRVALELLGDGARPEVRERIASDIAELDELIGELLLASRLEAAPELEARDEVDLLGLAAEEAARLGAKVGGEPLRIRGDARLLRRAVRNLLENAHRYGGGRPVEVRVEPLGPDRVRLLVCDEGPGIPEPERERIFEPFYRREGTRETGEGVGLGLSLVRQIAERHGGRVCVEPRAEGGSRFVIELPRTPTSDSP